VYERGDGKTPSPIKRVNASKARDQREKKKSRAVHENCKKKGEKASKHVTWAAETLRCAEKVIDNIDGHRPKIRGPMKHSLREKAQKREK